MKATYDFALSTKILDIACDGYFESLEWIIKENHVSKLEFVSSNPTKDKYAVSLYKDDVEIYIVCYCYRSLQEAEYLTARLNMMLSEYISKSSEPNWLSSMQARIVDYYNKFTSYLRKATYHNNKTLL